MDLGSALRESAFDIVASNPPYVPYEDAPSLEREVRDHEPSLALFARDKGLEVIRRLIPEAAGLLRSGGHAVFEIGAGMAADVTGLFDNRWETTRVRVKPDLQGIPRAVVARRA
jgi:release factor glutamine methyltransferase